MAGVIFIDVEHQDSETEYQRQKGIKTRLIFVLETVEIVQSKIIAWFIRNSLRMNTLAELEKHEALLCFYSL